MTIKSLPAAMLLAIALPAVAQDLPDRPIRRDEVIAAVKRQFARIDADRDGVVTRAEFERFRASPAGEQAAQAASPFEHVGGHWFDHADPQGSGRVTLEMAERHPLELFDMADVNRDGVVSPSERHAAETLRSLTGH